MYVLDLYLSTAYYRGLNNYLYFLVTIRGGGGP